MNTLTTISIIFNGLFLGYLLYRLISFIIDKTEDKRREKEDLQDRLEFLERQYRYLNNSIDAIYKSLIRDAQENDEFRMKIKALENEVSSINTIAKKEYELLSADNFIPANKRF